MLGHLKHAINFNKVKKWKSELFEIVGEFDHYTITSESDGSNWEYSDSNIDGLLPNRGEEDIMLALTQVPIEDNYYARRYSDQRVCITYHEMVNILFENNIPLENLMLRVLYSICILYKKNGNQLPRTGQASIVTHDETRGCVFDMNGIKGDVVYSLNKPQLCPACYNGLTNSNGHKLSVNEVKTIQKELKRIKKLRYYLILDFVKRNPYMAIFISLVTAFLIGVLSSLFASLFSNS